MKKILVLLVSVLWACQLHAGTITVTADDSFTGFTINGVSYLSSLGSASDLNDWRTTSSFNFDFLPGTTYELVWSIADLYHVAMGFIGAVDVGNGQIYKSGIGNEGWSFTSASPTALYNTTNGLAPWHNTVNSGLLAGANWVGYTSANHFEKFDTMTATLKFTTPVPLPAAAWMLGAGLVALVGVRRRMNR
jgi:hypothetical protein